MIFAGRGCGAAGGGGGGGSGRGLEIPWEGGVLPEGMAEGYDRNFRPCVMIITFGRKL